MVFTAPVQSCFDDIIADDMFLGSTDLPSRIEWHETGYGKVTAIEAGSASSPDGPRVALSRTPAVIQHNKCYLKPCGYWKGPGQIDQPFFKSKSNASAGAGTYPEVQAVWKSVTAGVRSITSMPALRTGTLALPAGSKVTKEVVTENFIDFRKENFVTSGKDDVDETTAASEQEQVNQSYGHAWTTAELPCVSEAAKRARDEYVESGVAAANPLLAYLVKFPKEPTAPSSEASSTQSTREGSTEEGEVPVRDELFDEASEDPTLELIEPGACDRVLRGSLVDLRISITRQYVHKRKQVMFLADVQEIFVLEQRVEAASTLGKRAGPSLFKNKRARS